MKHTEEEIKFLAYLEFLKRLGKHKLGDCMDLVPTPGFTL